MKRPRTRIKKKQPKKESLFEPRRPDNRLGQREKQSKGHRQRENVLRVIESAKKKKKNPKRGGKKKRIKRPEGP